MSEPTADVQVTSFELAAGTIRTVTLAGEDGIVRVVQVRVPPGTEDGAVLSVSAPGGAVEVRVTTTAPVPPPVAALPDFVSADVTATTPEQPEPPQAPEPAFAAAVIPPAVIPAAPPVSPTPPFSSTPPISSGPTPSWAPPPAASYPAYGAPRYHQSARSRRKVVLFTGITAAVVVLVVALITANAGGSSGTTDSADSTGQQFAPPAPTTTTQPPESAAAYQQALTGLATALNNGLAELNNAQTPAAISTATTDFANVIQQAATAFTAAPPRNTVAANNALVSALQSIGTDISSVGDAATGDEVCLGPAATALLSRSTSINMLRQAVATLTDGSGGLTYQFGALIPAVTQDGARTAANGSIVVGGSKHGLGELTITNGGDTDATVALVKGQGAPLVTVYMGHGGSYTLHHVPDGSYTVYVTSGDDWDAGTRLFSRSCDFEQFDQPMDFQTTSTEYTTYEITLTPVAGGTASESDVDPGAFPH